MKYFTTSRISDNIHETPEGFLVCYDVQIGRTGQMIYGEGETPLEVGDNGKVVIERSADELFNKDTIASFEGKAFTIKHPEDFVDPDNWSTYAKGVLQNVRRGSSKDENGEEALLSDILVTDKMAINLVKSGLREVSCGYEAIYEQLGPGKGKQKKIIGNHLALVEEGRAGASYAIRDHKKERSNMSFKERVLGIFAKAMDEAEMAEKKDEKKKESKDADKMSVEDLLKIAKDIKDVGEKISGMVSKDQDKDAPKAKDDIVEKKPDAEKKEEKTGDEPVVAPALEERLKALELLVSKLMEKQSEKAAEGGDEDPDKAEDEDDVEAEEMGDEVEESVSVTGDTASRAEILAPGIKVSKDVMTRALRACYETKEGKIIIEALNGGKAPTFDSAEKNSTLFIATAEVLKASRKTGLEGSKNGKSFDHGMNQGSGIMTPEKMNELNAAHWSKK